MNLNKKLFFAFIILIFLCIIPGMAAVGGKIAFTSNRDGSYEIYVMNPDGTGQTRLTYTYEDEFYPSWSPDGLKIVLAPMEEAAMLRSIV